MLAVAGCGGGATTGTTPSAAEALALVQRIYLPYARAGEDTPLLGNCFARPPTQRPCPGPAEAYVTPGLAARLVALTNEGTGQDAVVCAQNTPLVVRIDAAVVRGDVATVLVHTGYADGVDVPISVTVRLRDPRLEDIRC